MGSDRAISFALPSWCFFVLFCFFLAILGSDISLHDG